MSPGVSTTVIGSLARHYGIRSRRSGEYRHLDAIDRDWLHHEYVIRGRTLNYLAREKGMSAANMLRWAVAHGIPRRPRGGSKRRRVQP